MTPMYIIVIAAFLLTPLLYSKKKIHESLGLTLFCVLLFFFSAFRGDFTADYSNYRDIYASFIGEKLSVFFDSNYNSLFPVEKGYGLLNFILAKLFHDPQTIIIVTSAFIVWVYYKFGKKADDKFLYILFLINIGSYFQSFNVTRQVLAACICMCAYTYVLEKKPLRYCLVVLLAVTFHVSSIVMLPFYWLLRLKINIRNALLQIAITVVAFCSFDRIFAFADKILFDGKYSTYEPAGEVGLQAVVVPVAICLFVVFILATSTIVTKKKLEISPASPSAATAKWQENAILYNGTIYWMLTYFMATKYYYLYRFSAYFCIYAILGAVQATECIKNKRIKMIVKSGLIFALSVYYVFFGQYFGNYIFCF